MKTNTRARNAASRILASDPILLFLAEKHGKEVILQQLVMNASARAAWSRRESAKSIREARKLALKDARKHTGRNSRVVLYSEPRGSFALRRIENREKRLAEGMKDLGALGLAVVME